MSSRQRELRQHGLIAGTGLSLIGRFNYRGAGRFEIGWKFSTPWAPEYNVRANGLRG